MIATSANPVRLKQGWRISDLRRRLPENIEAGGVLSPEAVSIETGTPNAVLASSGVFTWHSHAEEPCLFSLQDWCSFILSPSLWSLLITPKHFRVYVKVDDRKLAECWRFILGYSRETPSVELMTRRLKKIIRKKNPRITPEMLEEGFGEAFGQAVGIRIGSEYRS